MALSGVFARRTVVVEHEARLDLAYSHLPQFSDEVLRRLQPRGKMDLPAFARGAAVRHSGARKHSLDVLQEKRKDLDHYTFDPTGPLIGTE